MSLALIIWNPQRMSFLMSPLGRTIGARIPAWIEVLRIKPSSWAIWRKVPWFTPLWNWLASWKTLSDFTTPTRKMICRHQEHQDPKCLYWIGQWQIILGAWFSPMWLSKWITLTGPQRWYVERKADRVVVWSPPSVTIRGVLKSLELLVLPETIYRYVCVRQTGHDWTLTLIGRWIYLVAGIKLFQGYRIVLMYR